MPRLYPYGKAAPTPHQEHLLAMIERLKALVETAVILGATEEREAEGLRRLTRETIEHDKKELRSILRELSGSIDIL